MISTCCGWNYCENIICCERGTCYCSKCNEIICLKCFSNYHEEHKQIEMSLTTNKQPQFTRIKLVDLEKNPKLVWQAMKNQGYFILTDIGEGTKKYSKFMSELKQFFSSDLEIKNNSQSKAVYRNERGVPMWYIGYETSQMREAFRVPKTSTDSINWHKQSFHDSWVEIIDFLSDITDRCLAIVTSREKVKPKSIDDDKSVAYAVFYPNNCGGQQEEGINISQHIDPSLFVIEPCTNVKGLDIFDRSISKWITIEDYCEAGKELIVFGGTALERATKGQIKGTLHRVSQNKESGRYVVIFEQKYAEFYPPPVFDD